METIIRSLKKELRKIHDNHFPSEIAIEAKECIWNLQKIEEFIRRYSKC